MGEAGSEKLDGKGKQECVCMYVWEEEGNSSFSACGRWPCKFLSEYSREESRSLLLCPEASRDSLHPRADRQENKGDTQTASSSGDHGLSERDTCRQRKEWPSSKGSERTLQSPSGRDSEG